MMAFVIVGCQTYRDDYNLLFSNNSGRIVTIGRRDGFLDRVTLYYHPIKPYETESLIYGTGKRQSWAAYLLEYEILSIHIYEGSVDKHFIYDDNSDDVKFLAKYQFTLQDLEKLHWAFSYPPNEAMKDVQMEPPYSTFQ